MTRLTDSLDNGRVSFGDREEAELATAIDPVCGRELKRADAAAAVDYRGSVHFFCSLPCRDQFKANPDRYVPRDASRR
jgi:YHS domain-containing protein